MSVWERGRCSHERKLEVGSALSRDHRVKACKTVPRGRSRASQRGVKSKEGREEGGVASYQKDNLCTKAALPRHAPSPKRLVFVTDCL